MKLGGPKKMPIIKVLLDPREYKEATASRGNKPWRTVILDALDVEETPRRLGRPRR